jgi:hypothetical protein
MLRTVICRLCMLAHQSITHARASRRQQPQSQPRCGRIQN